MTSDLAMAPGGASKSRKELDLAIGQKRVSLKGLTDQELVELLHQWLTFDMQELRGFKPLKSFLDRSTSDEVYQLAPEFEFVVENIERSAVTLESQMHHVGRGCIEDHRVFGKQESNETTTDITVAHKWGEYAYIKSGRQRMIFMCRPNKHAYPYQQLFDVWYSYTKVPCQNRFLIDGVDVEHVPIEKFRAHFGEHANRLVKYLLWEIASIFRQTHEDLQAQANRMQEKAQWWNRLGDKISE